MHQEGHYGVALAVYSPVGFLVLAANRPELALAGGAVVVGGAMLPDVDMRLPFVKHRGITHTVWFALAVGVVLGLVGAAVGHQNSIAAALTLGCFGLLIGVLTVGAHLLADALTPMGIRPFTPIDGREYSLNVTKAANPIANYVLFGVGIAVAAIAASAGLALG